MKYEPVYIYALIDPRDDKIRYIGKSINPEQRYERHLHEKETNAGKVGWISGLQIRGMQPEMKILEVANEKNWKKRERWWIERGREFGWPLLNITPGGEGGRRTSLPSSFYWLLDKPLLDKLELLPHRTQADIVIECAEAVAEILVEKIKCVVDDDMEGYYKLENLARRITVNNVERLCKSTKITHE